MAHEKNGSRWYDGFWYSLLIDPLAGGSFARPVLRMVPENSSAIDIGCGTGALVLALSGKCSHVTGVDLSRKMTAFGQKRLRDRSIPNAEIICMPATELASTLKRKYDFAVMTQILHEVPAETRDRVIEEAKKIAGKFIIADFLSPYPETWPGRFVRLIEKSAGREHNANFKDWVARGGIDAFLEKHGLRVMEERIFSTGAGKIVMAVSS